MEDHQKLVECYNKLGRFADKEWDAWCDEALEMAQHHSGILDKYLELSNEEWDKWYNPYWERMEYILLQLYVQFHTNVSSEEKVINDLFTLICETGDLSLLAIGKSKLHTRSVSDGLREDIRRFALEKIDELPQQNPLFDERLCEIKNYLKNVISEGGWSSKKVKREVAKMAKLKPSREEAAWMIYEGFSGKKYDASIGVHISIKEGAYIALLLAEIGYIAWSQINYNPKFVDDSMRKSWWQLVKHHFRPKK